mmetsp:Transcript_44313/g.60114  ORF Transcript_44313/g.60114 Transcript_44313/m.60114 type:complete len:218 (-) Transcript_44313:229-882(-)
MSSHGEREKFLVIKLTRFEEERWLTVEVCRPWLIEDIVTHNMLIGSILFGNNRPEVHHLVQKAIFVVIESSECRSNLRHCVHIFKVTLGAFLRNGKTILTHRDVIVFKWFAFASHFESKTKNGVRASSIQILRSIEVRNTLTTQTAREQILVVVNNHIHTVGTETVDKFIDTVKVVVVVNSGSSFDGFPHNTKTNNVGTPVLEKLKIFVTDGSLPVE